MHENYFYLYWFYIDFLFLCVIYFIDIGGEKLSNQDHFDYYLWNIQNKYYKAQVLICVIENSSQNISINDVEALIVHHDPQTVRYLNFK